MSVLDPSASNSKSPTIIGYLSCPQDGAKGYLGALLITDERTRPLHFAYTEPIRPTALQRLLYGHTLDEYVKIDVIARTLLTGLSIDPSLLFVDSPVLLALRRIVRIPVAALSRPPREQGQLATVLYDTGGRTDHADAVGAVVARLEQHVNLLSPFERISEALREALKQGSG